MGWWWRRWPTANLAIATGSVSGIDVVDIDVHADGSGFPAARRAHAEGLLDGWGLAVSTPSGGLHLYFPHPPGVVQRGWGGRGVQVDFRGDGGYIVAAPSRVIVPDGAIGSYRLTATGRSPGPVDAAGLRRFVEPVRHLHAVPAATAPDDGADPDRLAAWLAARPDDGRRQRLYWASCRMVEAGFDYHSTLGALGPAAVHVGLDEPYVERTVRNAFRYTRPTDPCLRAPAPAHGYAGEQDVPDASLSDPGDDEGHQADEVVSI